ncbi:MAG: FHA domain-containing protein [Fimbriiglobus sp.]
MKFFLIVAKGKRRGFPVPIDVDLFLIGSAKACQLRADHPDIGEQHCAVSIRGRKAFIRDMGSGQGTFVNGSEMPVSEEWPLRPNDLIAVGPLEFRVSFNERSMTKADLEEWALKTLDEDTGPKVSALEELEKANRGPMASDTAASAADAMIAKMSAAKGVVRGRLRIMREGPVTIVKVQDNYMVEGPELAHMKKEFFENLDVPNLRVLLDMKNVMRMSTSAATLMAELRDWLRKRGSTFALCRLRPELGGMVSDLTNVFQLKAFTTKEEAVAAKW